VLRHTLQLDVLFFGVASPDMLFNAIFCALDGIIELVSQEEYVLNLSWERMMSHIEVKLAG